MQKTNKKVIESDVFNIALELKTIHKWCLTDSELKQLVNDAMPYINKSAKTMDSEPISEIIKKVLIDYHAISNVSNIALNLNKRAWHLTNYELDQIVNNTKPYIIKAIMSRHTFKLGKEKRQEPVFKIMEKMLIDYYIAISEISNIALDWNAEKGLNDNELETIISETRHHIIKAVMLKYMANAKVLKQSESVSDTIKNVFTNYHKDSPFVHILMYSYDEETRNNIINEYEDLIRATIYCRFKWIIEDGLRDIEDVIEDSLIDILENLSSFGYRSRLKTWIVAITANRCKLIVGDIEKERNRLVRDDNIINNEQINIDPINEMEREEMLKKLCQYILQTCKEMNRSNISIETKVGIIKDKFIYGMSNVEIAKKYDVREGTVGSIIHRFKERLCKKVDETYIYISSISIQKKLQ